MNEQQFQTYEQQAGRAFDAQAPVFDVLYGEDKIIRYKRKRVREHVLPLLKTASHILELNAGTGEDAVFFAKNGHAVHATDIADSMLAVLRAKIRDNKVENLVSTETCSFTELETLKHPGPYDMIFSNFAGLNCTHQLSRVLDSFPHLLKPGGLATLVILPEFCLWEFLLLFKGKFKTAFRRFSGKKGSSAKIDDHYFRCWYYNPSFIKKYLEPGFELIKLEGLCTLVPPSYMEGFAEKWPRLYKSLVKKEENLKSSWPWRSIGDYYIITLRKK